MQSAQQEFSFISLLKNDRRRLNERVATYDPAPSTSSKTKMA
jgi:hypothetical protein